VYFAGIYPYEFEQLISIYQVKVTGNAKVACGNGIVAYKGMAELYIVLALGGVAQVAHQQLAQEADVAFHEARELGNFRLVFLYLLDLVAHFAENIANGLRGAAPETVHEGYPWFCIEFYGGYTRTILSAVMLLFHEQVQLIKPKENRSVFLLIIREWLP
jgi:hypothetical protein